MGAISYTLAGLGWLARFCMYALMALRILADMAYCWWKGIKDDE